MSRFDKMYINNVPMGDIYIYRGCQFIAVKLLTEMDQ